MMNQNNISLETVLYALYGCANVQSEFTGAVYVCPTCAYGKEDGRPCESLHPLLDDAYALLKAQEPHVMTLEELVVDDVVWLEDCDKETTVPGIYCNRNDTDTVFATRMKGYLFVRNDEYGKRWRCWTSKPTNKQMEETKWA